MRTSDGVRAIEIEEGFSTPGRHSGGLRLGDHDHEAHRPGRGRRADRSHVHIMQACVQAPCPRGVGVPVHDDAVGDRHEEGAGIQEPAGCRRSYITRAQRSHRRWPIRTWRPCKHTTRAKRPKASTGGAAMWRPGSQQRSRRRGRPCGAVRASRSQRTAILTRRQQVLLPG